MNWFEEWFDSPYYHQLYCNRNEAEAKIFIEKIAGSVHIPQNAKILDAACGKGRHSLTLAHLGFKVTGIDLSKNSIEYAKQFESERLHFAVHDIRETYHTNQFDFVFNLFSSFGYFENELEDLKVIKAFSETLKHHGTLVLDYINCEWAVKNIKSKEIVQRNETQFHIQKKLEKGFIVKDVDFLTNGENYHYQERLKVISLNRFEEMLAISGFTLLQTFGDYALNKFKPTDSERLILIARKTLTN